MLPSSHRPFSMRWKPVNSGSSGPLKSSTRLSMAPSLSGKSSATGSMRSHGRRTGAYSAFAAATSPPLTAVTNSVVPETSWSTCWLT